MIILDTSFIVAQRIENDEHHDRAIELIREIADGNYGKALISDYIFDEVLNVIFGRTKKLENAIEAGSEIINSVEIVKVSDLLESSWEIFKNQKGTRFSFTDCTILSLMDKNKIEHIATFDGDFKKIKNINVIGV